jgi:hypothetical protein
VNYSAAGSLAATPSKGKTMDDWEYLERFTDLVNENHVDPCSAFESLSAAQAEGKKVGREVREVMVEAGIIEDETVIEFDDPDDRNAAMIRAVASHYSDETKGAWSREHAAAMGYIAA